MDKVIRVAIMGCGPGGSYLYKLLRERKPELDITLFDKQPSTACGSKPCAWGVDRRQFVRLCRFAGLDAGKFITGTYDRIAAGSMTVKADIAIINKPSFLKSLLGNVQPSDSRIDITAFDRVIDATGVRAYLPPPSSEAAVETVQIKAAASSVNCPVVIPRKDAGYSWLFPAGEGQAHVGSLSETGIAAAVKHFREAKGMVINSTLCSCTGRVWCGGIILPFIHGNVWGLGESIGLVDPVPGAGIIPAMNSARLMAEHWDEPTGYQRAILKSYGYMAKEARLVASLKGGRRPALMDLLLPARAYANIGVYPTLRQIAHVVVKAARLNRK